ncbi:uroplakin-3b-like protein 1 [Amblyraja radiata]|uniref:uroplakin-3b-like protein 1 n=1 Tax=Amblyraja radiata TaxID=386614 RepID=UPI001403FC5C|nr:uroplakin-3b-like protein 1 [Amblyraja radiata]
MVVKPHLLGRNSFGCNLRRQKNLTKAHWDRKDYPSRGEKSSEVSRTVNDSGPRSVMELLPQFVLLCALCGAGYGAEELAYVPEILQATIIGKVSQTTFALEQPHCVFDDIQTDCNLCEIWLVVDNTTRASTFDNDMNTLTPTAAMYQSFLLNGFYITVKTARSDYTCLSTTSPIGQVYTLRVGDEIPCTTNNCNAPLDPGSLVRVRYAMINPLVTTNNVIAVTAWSSDIQLNNAADQNIIDTSTRWSAGMIVITTILTILLILLLLLFIVMLALSCCSKTDSYPGPLSSFGSIREYSTHSLKDPRSHYKQNL